MANELLGAADFIADTLLADATVTAIVGRRVVPDFQPDIDPATQKAPLWPAVLYHLQSGGQDSIAVGALRIQTNPAYCIQAIGTEGYDALEVLANRIDALFEKVLPTIVVSPGGVSFVVRCHRDHPLMFSEVSSLTGVRYYHIGGVYSFTVNV